MLPAPMLATLEYAHPSWHAVLRDALTAVDRATPGYLQALAANDYSPTQGRLLAAFAQPLPAVRYVLIGEGPYPRAASATGVCFMDGAVDALWSDNGLSKAVNRATSLRNFIKLLLVAEGALTAHDTGADAMAPIGRRAQLPGSGQIHTLPQLQANLTRQGFLLLNASLVFRPQVAPAQDAAAWLPLMTTVLSALAEQGASPPTLVLWGKIAGRVLALPGIDRFPQVQAEHPYNLTFIRNVTMQDFFRPMRLLADPAREASV